MVHDLPEDWLTPRKEFAIGGFGDERHVYTFEVAELQVSNVGGIKLISGARCCECSGTMYPDRETLVDHAKLHLAVKLAKQEIGKHAQ